jgi:hypothetical protein
LAIGETAHDVPLTDMTVPEATPLGIILTDRGVALGAIRLSLDTNALVSKVDHVVEADCTETHAYHNAIRPTVKDTLQNHDFLELTLGSDTYLVSLGYRGNSVRLLAKEK